LENALWQCLAANLTQSLAVWRVCRQEESMARFPLFLVSSALIGIGLVGISVLPLLPKPTLSVEAKREGGAFAFNAATLNAIIHANGFPVTQSPGPRGDQIGPRLASSRPFGPDTRDRQGATLRLGPKTGSALQGRPITIMITLRGIPKSASQKIALGLVGDGSIDWVEANVPADFGTLRINLPPINKPVQAIAFWPSTQGQNLGVEIRSMTLQTSGL
jgi:hypothetical protein